MALWKGAAGLAAAAVITAHSPVLFEAKPRIVANGHDPQIAVRASGALSLLKVEKGNLWLETSLDRGDTFEPAVRVNDIEGEVISHAESSPQLQVRTRSEMYCLWQAKRPGNEDTSALRFARSMNWGESFTKAIDIAPVAGAPAQQSFYTMEVSPAGTVYVAWLDGRDRAQCRAGTAAVYIARSVNKGVSFETSQRVALDACPCCRPSIAFTGNNVHVAWRRVIDGNVRDVYVSTSHDAGRTWAAPVRVAEDNWKLNGCPHSGGALATLGNRLFIAWHAVRDDKAQLSLAYSSDAGSTFSRRIPVSGDVLDPNHPFLEASGDKLSLVFQGRDSRANEGWAPVDVYFRQIRADGTLSQLERIGHAGGSASYPVFTFEDPGRFYVTWTEPRNDERVVVMARGRTSDVASGALR